MVLAVNNDDDLVKKEVMLGVNIDDITKIGVREVMEKVIHKENVMAIDDLVKARLEVRIGVVVLKRKVCLERSFFLIWIMRLIN